MWFVLDHRMKFLWKSFFLCGTYRNDDDLKLLTRGLRERSLNSVLFLSGCNNLSRLQKCADRATDVEVVRTF